MTHKYNACKTEIDGILFDSKREAQRYTELKLLERAGEISALRVQPKYLILDSFMYRGHKIRETYYIADFEYRGKIIDGAYEIITEDVKGVKTAAFMLKQKMFKKLYPWIDFRIVK